MPYIITDPAEQGWEEYGDQPEMVSYCCGKPAVPETLQTCKYGVTGMCSQCREWTTFEPEPGKEDES